MHVTLRLGLFLFQRITKDHGGVDGRFDGIRENFCIFSVYWCGQGAWVFLCALPLFIVNNFAASPSVTRNTSAVTVLDGVGWGLWILGWSFELVGDAQKTAFKNNPENRGKFCNEGLWSITRHPNYFGELILWIGIAVSASSAAAGAGWLLLLSPVFTAYLMLLGSGVPKAETTSLKKYRNVEGYMDYIENVSVFVPFCSCWTGWLGREKDM